MSCRRCRIPYGNSRAVTRACGRNCFGKGWRGVRDEILFSIGSMGGPDAKRILTAYVRNEHADALGTAVYALSMIDPEAARREAKSILACERARFIDSPQIGMLKKLAGEK